MLLVINMRLDPAASGISYRGQTDRYPQGILRKEKELQIIVENAVLFMVRAEGFEPATY